MGRLLRIENVLALLLVFIPVAAVLEYVVHAGPTLVFLAAALAIVPLAGFMGRSTEMLAERVGAGLGGLLNATFGNAAELIIAFFALREGLHDLVKASLTGSIIGNILLVFGLAALLGGLRRARQTFNRTAASMGSTLLLLSAIALVIPAIYHEIVGEAAPGGEQALSLEISLVLIVAYALGLLFTLRTHAHLYAGEPGAGAAAAQEDAGEAGQTGDGAGEVKDEETHEEHASGHGGDDGHAIWPTRVALAVLVGSAALVGWMGELLVGAAEVAAEELGMNEIFIGVIVVAMIGNAAEHSTAILVALEDKMDLAIQIAVGSSVQIALFVAPLLVFLSYVVGPGPMDLRFTALEVVAVGLAVLTIAQIANDGKSHWMEGVLLLAVYAILALAFYALPMHAAG